MISKIQEEKRRYTRVVFNKQSKVQAILVVPGKEEPVQQMPASVLNISEGGVQVSIERREFQEMQPNDIALLSRLKGIPDLEVLQDFSIQVIWIMDNEYLEHILLGVAFIALSEQQHDILRCFVENRLALSTKRKSGEALR